MSDKRVKDIVRITIFSLAIVMPTIVYALAGKYVGTQSYEQRTLALKPSLMNGNVEMFPEDFEAYYSDNMPFRNQLIRLNSYIGYHLFNDTPSEKVVLGKDGWLFYYGDIENQLDFWNFSSGQINQITRNLINANNVLNDQGIEMMLYVVPDKARIYSEYVSDYIAGRMVEDNSTIQLLNFLSENVPELKVVFPYDTLANYKSANSDVMLFSKGDTHWNTVGSYLGALDFLSALNEEADSIENQVIVCEENNKLSGDLAVLLNTSVRGANEYAIDYELTGYTKTDIQEVNGFAYEHQQGVADEKRNLFVSRDSFALALSDFIAPAFRDSTWVHNDYFEEKQLFESGADVYVYECVERQLSSLYDFNISFIDIEENVSDGSRVLNISPIVPHPEGKLLRADVYEVADDAVVDIVTVISDAPLSDCGQIFLEDGKRYLVSFVITDEEANVLEIRDYKVNLP